MKIELIQETDQSIKDKSKTLTASDALPDIYFTWTGNWAENYVRGGGRAADLTKVIGPDTEWGKTFSKASLSAFAYDGRYYGIPLYNNGKFMGYNKAAFTKAASSRPPPRGAHQQLRHPAQGRLRAHRLRQQGRLARAALPPAAVRLQRAERHPARRLPPSTAKLADPGYVTALKQFKDPGRHVHRHGQRHQRRALHLGPGGLLQRQGRHVLPGDPGVRQRDCRPRDHPRGLRHLPRCRSPAARAGNPKVIEGAPEGYLVNAKSPRAALAVDFMKFVTEQENAKTLSLSPCTASPARSSAPSPPETSSKAVFEGIELVNKAPELASWLDMVTVPEVADAWLAGGEALISGGKKPEQVLESVPPGLRVCQVVRCAPSSSGRSGSRGSSRPRARRGVRLPAARAEHRVSTLKWGHLQRGPRSTSGSTTTPSLLDDPIFWSSFGNNLLYGGDLDRLPGVRRRLLLAALIESIRSDRWRRSLRAIYFIPSAISC
ncbi:extracellular solute-binding protein [Nonomuraea dietziae]|uniref:extracellular solute-binding protein n=1 Tax=Nonomuraea dietziae TaxID=65515 RepID=UPI0031CFB921